MQFALARGFRHALDDVQRSLDLPVPATLLDRLAEQAAPHHRGYRLVGFTGSGERLHPTAVGQ